MGRDLIVCCWRRLRCSILRRDFWGILGLGKVLIWSWARSGRSLGEGLASLTIGVGSLMGRVRLWGIVNIGMMRRGGLGGGGGVIEILWRAIGGLGGRIKKLTSGASRSVGIRGAVNPNLGVRGRRAKGSVVAAKNLTILILTGCWGTMTTGPRLITAIVVVVGSGMLGHMAKVAKD